jgi:hypothetical protein
MAAIPFAQQTPKLCWLRGKISLFWRKISGEALGIDRPVRQVSEDYLRQAH